MPSHVARKRPCNSCGEPCNYRARLCCMCAYPSERKRELPDEPTDAHPGSL